MRLRWFGYLKRMRNNRMPKMIMEWNAQDRRTKGKPKEQWIDEVRSMISKDFT